MRLARDAKVTYPLVQDTSDNQLFRLFGGTGMPTTVFLTANGSVQQTHSGELSADLLRGPPARTSEQPRALIAHHRTRTPAYSGRAFGGAGMLDGRRAVA